MVDLASTIFRDFETDGVPASGTHKPRKSKIREWGAYLEGFITAFVSNGGLIYSSKAALDSDLAKAANAMAWVVGDPVAANNGVYGKVGASGSGSWARRADLPFSFIVASNVGAGTPNAIQATTSIPVSGSALVWVNVAVANTGPVTVSFNGGAPLAVKTNTGNDVAPGGLQPGMIVMGIVSGSTFRLVNDQVSGAVVAAAEAAANRAEAAAATFAVLNEDDMASASTTRPPSQKSTKTYVDAAVGRIVFGTRALASAAAIAAPVVAILVGGHTAFGDAPLTTYVEVPKTGAVEIDQIETNGGTRRWQIMDGPVDIRSVGIFPANTGAAVANATRMNALIARQRNIYVPPCDFYFDGTIRLISGTFIRGATVNGVTWTNTAILASYKSQSRLIFMGTRSACFDSDPATPLNHGAISDIAIMVPDTAQYNAIFFVHGMLAWTFRGVRLENSSPSNAGGFLSTQIGANPTWLNRFFDVEIRIPDTSNGQTFNVDWSDSVIIGCTFTGGAGAYYKGPGNVEVVGGNYERAKAGAGAWTVDKLTNSSTSIKFIGCNFDENETYGLVVVAANSPGGNFFGVIVQGCHFRSKATATADIVFVDHASTNMIGPVISGNVHSVAGPVRMTVNYAKWDIVDANNQSPTGAPWTAYAPTLAVGSGSLTSATAVGRYQRIGRTVHFHITITITTNGTAATSLTASLPFTGRDATAVQAYNATNGNLMGARVGGGVVTIATPTNTYPGANSTTLVVSGTYEAAA